MTRYSFKIDLWAVGCILTELLQASLSPLGSPRPVLFAAHICHPLSPLPANLALLNQPKEYYLQTFPDLLTLHAKFFIGNLLPQRDLAFLGPRGHQQVDYVWKL